MTQPLRSIHDKRLNYLVGLEKSYQEMGYSTKLNGRDNILEVYEKGIVPPKTEEELVIEKWIH